MEGNGFTSQYHISMIISHSKTAGLGVMAKPVSPIGLVCSLFRIDRTLSREVNWIFTEGDYFSQTSLSHFTEKRVRQGCLCSRNRLNYIPVLL